MDINLMKKHDRGWANLDVALALIVVMAMTVFGLTKYKDWQQEKNWQVEASHISTYAAAARGYVGRNYATLLNATSTTAPTVITTAMLKNTGFLPSGFTETNSQGQRLNTYLVRNGQNTELLQGMVVSSGGSVYPDKALRLISRDIKTGFGGYIDDGKTATGALRSWKILLSSYGATSGNGHIAVLLSTDELSGAQEDNDRLYRFQVNGRPDLNKMHTAIDMGGNNLNSVGTINGQTGTFSGNVSGSNGIFTSNVSGANGSFTQNITAGAQVKGATVRADSDISAGRNITATNEVSGATVKATGNLSAGGVLQLDRINVAGIACYPNGQISRDANGGVLSCQSGAWTSSGKVSAFEMIQGNDACGKYVYSKAYCPAGKQLISGGWVLSNWTGGNGWNAPDSSMPSPSDNAWQLVTGGGVTGGTCMRAIAWCAKN
ncbi:shufflon system plasmid conjugative transfer pilus tip adhesin PilV [Citrobacter freundii]|uniref:shufflon system plasmid conjugative transfer pilus tip adhesin PilV n=1 Tax=Citrobacter freundii TaxID=546 RepID=UPI003CE57816